MREIECSQSERHCDERAVPRKRHDLGKHRQGLPMEAYQAGAYLRSGFLDLPLSPRAYKRGLASWVSIAVD